MKGGSMRMSYYSSQKKTYESVLKMIEDGAAETSTREFKERLNISNAEEKYEFLADVTAMANSIGGEIIFGVRETADGFEVVGVDPQDFDELILKIENIIRDHTEPRVNCIIEILKGNETKPIIIMYIEKSYKGPHRILTAKCAPFYKRNSSGKHAMDTFEIKAAYLEGYLYEQRIEEFVNERYILVTNELPSASSWMMLHVIPEGSFDRGSNLSMDALKQMKIMPQNCHGCYPRVNFDGFMNFASAQGDYFQRGSYVQIFRNGIIESFASGVVSSIQGGLFYLEDWEVETTKHINELLSFLQVLKVSGPYFVTMALNGLKMARLKLHSHSRDYVCDRNFLKLPTVILDPQVEDINITLSRSIRTLRNAFGKE